MTSRTSRRLWVAACSLLFASACFSPDEQRPGLWLSGEKVTELPSDWGFADAHKEIAIQVSTPYLVAHSVTIWCVSVDGGLYVAARDPDTKHWPGWVDKKPDARLDIDGKLYDVRLTRLEGPDAISAIRDAYALKYDLPKSTAQEGPPMRYWRIGARG